MSLRRGCGRRCENLEFRQPISRAGLRPRLFCWREDTMFIDEIKIYAQAGHGGTQRRVSRSIARLTSPRAGRAAAMAGAAAASSCRPTTISTISSGSIMSHASSRRPVKAAWAKAWTVTREKISSSKFPAARWSGGSPAPRHRRWWKIPKTRTMMRAETRAKIRCSAPARASVRCCVRPAAFAVWKWICRRKKRG